MKTNKQHNIGQLLFLRFSAKIRKSQRRCVSKLIKDQIIPLLKSPALLPLTTRYKKDRPGSRPSYSSTPSLQTFWCQREIAPDQTCSSVSSLSPNSQLPRGRYYAQLQLRVRSKINIPVDVGKKSINKSAAQTSRLTVFSSPLAIKLILDFQIDAEASVREKLTFSKVPDLQKEKSTASYNSWTVTESSNKTRLFGTSQKLRWNCCIVKRHRQNINLVALQFANVRTDPYFNRLQVNQTLFHPSYRPKGGVYQALEQFSSNKTAVR